MARLERDLKNTEHQRAQAQSLLDNCQARLNTLESKNKALDAENAVFTLTLSLSNYPLGSA